MKKFVSIILVIVLMASICSVASAATEYSLTLLSLDAAKQSASSWVATSDARELCAALVWCDYILADGNNDIALYGTGYIAAYGTCVDIYFPRSSGSGYHNLFLAQDLGHISDYGTSYYGPSSTDYTYYTLSMSGVASMISAVADALKN